MSGKIHEAGEPIGLIQRCMRCGEVLDDYTNTVGYGEWKPSWWIGTVTVYPGNPTHYQAGRGEDATECSRGEQKGENQ